MPEKDEIIGSFENGKRFTIMIRTGTYKGKPYVDIRSYFKDAEGQFRPTPRGIRVEQSKFLELKKLVDKVPLA